MRPHNIPVQDGDPGRIVVHSNARNTDHVANHDDTANDDPSAGNKIFQPKAQNGFSIDDFDLIRVIGRGSYAKVITFITVPLSSIRL